MILINFFLEIILFILDSNNRISAPMIIGIVVTTSFLILIILIIIGIFCCRWRRNRLTSNINKCKKKKHLFLIK